ncbi:MAG: hypothetical protein HYW48_03665 [Deltaproteobacteria bacterium]|nr:hypothetical protein [Deltaproteobacteria bacterium]
MALLAKRAKVITQVLHKIEKREAEGKVTLETMRKIAWAMDCEFIYALVPRKEIKFLLKEKALEKATRLIEEADIHMTLEDQKVTEDFKTRIERLAETLLKKGDVW